MKNLVPFSMRVFLLMIFLMMPAISQTVQPKRPKIGLVLSGGGARGFAHIGVLRVLEENHIPVDYIGGASMGALVGAMYSLGYSPDEMDAFIRTVDWTKLLKPGTSYDDLSFRRKEDTRNIAVPVALSGRLNDLKLPNALNSGHEVGLLLDRIVLPYARVRKFNELPIPFSCVATDMVKGESVVLSQGSLATSLRATMSIPGFFSPVEIDGRLLSDGGLVNNIPTDVVKAMGADILLVVNIETQLSERQALDSILGVLSQTINIASADNSRRSLRQANIIIAPDLKDFSSRDFDKFVEIERLGYDGAKQNEMILKGLSLDDAAWKQHLEERRLREKPDEPLTPAFIAVATTNPGAETAVLEKLGDKFTGKPFDENQQRLLENDLSQLVGTRRVDALSYEVQDRDGATGLLIRSNAPKLSSEKPTRLEVGVDVNSTDSDNVNFNLRARMTFFDIGGAGTEWRNDIRIGSNPRIATEYYRPLGNTKYFLAPRASYERRRIDLYQDGTRLAEYSAKTAEFGIDLGYSMSANSEFRIGYSAGYQSALHRIGATVLPEVSGPFSAVGAKWAWDSLNNSQAPTNGVYSQNTLNYYFDTAGADGRIGQFETRNFYFRSLSERKVLFLFGGGGTSFGSTAPTLNQFTLGGPFRLGGYGNEEFRTSNYVQGGAGILYNPKIFPTFLGGKVYVGGWYEAGSPFEKISTAPYLQSFSGGAVIETPLGPFFVGSSINEDGRSRFYFSFGRVFR